MDFGFAGQNVNQVALQHGLAQVLDVGRSAQFVLVEDGFRGEILHTVHHRVKEIDLLGCQRIEQVAEQQPHLVDDVGVCGRNGFSRASAFGAQPHLMRQLLHIIGMRVHLADDIRS